MRSRNKVFPILVAVLIVLALAVPFAAAEGEPLKIAAVSASADDGNLPANVIDGDLETRWSASGDGNWIMLDLGKEQTISYVGIAFHKGNERSSRFEIEVSDDAAKWTRIFSGAGSGRTTDLEAFDLPDITARYLRYIGHGNNNNAWNSLCEFQIYAPNPAGLILHKPVARPKETPVPVMYVRPGLVNPDGSVHAIPPPHRVTGKTLNVVDFGADPRDSATDDVPAIQKAIDTAVSRRRGLPAGRGVQSQQRIGQRSLRQSDPQRRREPTRAEPGRTCCCFPRTMPRTAGKARPRS